MLKIHRNILQKLTEIFLSVNQEQGFLLGCKICLEQLEFCHQIPPVQAGKYHYIPNGKEADLCIYEWAERGICFCGFVHSHLAGQMDLSEDDVLFAKQLCKTYNLPILWFGIGVVNHGEVDFRYYSIRKENNIVRITPVCWEVL